MELTRFTVIGLGGFAQAHLAAVDWLEEIKKGTLTGVVALPEDRKINHELFEKLQQRGITFFPSIDAFFESNGCADTDVLTVPIGIHQHVPVSVRAMAAGLHVYCEKPIAATIQEADTLVAAEKKYNRKIAIGYQYLYSSSIQRLKNNIADKRLGDVKSIKLLCSWPRSEDYFNRNGWAGRMRVGENWVLDSPANNAVSHYLMNVLYLATGAPRAAIPQALEAELYRANNIESTDLVQLKIVTDDAVACHITFAHCAEKRVGPMLQVEGTAGTAIWSGDLGETEIVFKNGEIERYEGESDPAWRYWGFRDLVDAIAENRAPLCTPGLARSQTLAINLMHESCPEIKTIPVQYIERVEALQDYPPDVKAWFNFVKNLDAVLQQCYEDGAMLSETDMAWATQGAGKQVSAAGYSQFPQSKLLG